MTHYKLTSKQYLLYFKVFEVCAKKVFCAASCRTLH